VLAEAVRRNREGKVRIEPGYDGEYGKVRIFEPGERETSGGQMFFFPELEKKPAVKARGSSLRKNKQKKALIPPAPSPTSSQTVTRKPASSAEEDILGELNERQREAVTALESPLVVIAGPGTGKTRCLAARAAYLVRVLEVPPEKILALTFTNKAAREMKERILRNVGNSGERESSVTVSTFHSFCLDLLSEIRGSIPIVADEAESLSLLRDALPAGGTTHKLSSIALAISRAKAEGTSPENYRGPEDIRQAFTAYRDLCRRMGVCDYDDLIIEVLESLRRDPARVDSLHERYPYLLVDEFQDVNPAQYELLKLLAGSRPRGLFVIGDPDQSIYGFRGADSRVFEHLKLDYPGSREVRLELGYRCSQLITEAAGAFISANHTGEKPLQALGRGGEPIRLIRCPTELSESIAVVREITRLVGGLGMLSSGSQRGGSAKREIETLYSFADCAVIARTQTLCETLEEAFVTEGIPCRLRGSKSFLEDVLVRQLLSFLRLVVNPRDELRFLNALYLVGLNPGDGYISSLREQARASGRSLLSELKYRLSREVPLSRKGKIAAEFLLTFEKYRRRIAESPGELLASLLEEFVREPGRSANALESLVTVAGQFDTLDEFLPRLAVQAEGDIERSARGMRKLESEAVTLMTMHAAKGLEFKVVFICGVEEGILPFTYRRSDVEEERRLFYVSLTRAAERLYLTSAAKRKVRGRLVNAGWSPFLKELPARLLVEQKTELPSKPPERQLKLF